MEIDKAINRLSFLIQKGYKANNTDADALNSIIDYVNKQREENLNNHEMFAKIYINAFTNDLIRSDGNYQLCADSLRMVLKKPLNSIYDTFHNEINTIEFTKISNKLGICNKHPILKTPEENASDQKIIKENAKDLTKALSHYNKKDVYSRLNTLINNLIEDY